MRVLRRSRPLKPRTAINDVTTLVVVVLITMLKRIEDVRKDITDTAELQRSYLHELYMVNDKTNYSRHKSVLARLSK